MLMKKSINKKIKFIRFPMTVSVGKLLGIFSFFLSSFHFNFYH